MLHTESLSFAYNTGKTLRFADFACHAGQKLLLYGESGSGKTTLLHLLAGILKPVSGSIKINETNIALLKGVAMDRFRGKHIGLVFQHNYFIHSVSLLENLLAAQYLPGFKVNKQTALELIERLGLSGLEHKKPATLSMGEKQRFSVARALINKPLLLLADEPTSSLDDTNCVAFMELIEEQTAASDTCLVVASHDNRLKPRFETSYLLSKL
jgi:ABC-type lipoprotein export system ATPase subunit